MGLAAVVVLALAGICLAIGLMLTGAAIGECVLLALASLVLAVLSLVLVAMQDKQYGERAAARRLAR